MRSQNSRLPPVHRGGGAADQQHGGVARVAVRVDAELRVAHLTMETGMVDRSVPAGALLVGPRLRTRSRSGPRCSPGPSGSGSRRCPPSSDRPRPSSSRAAPAGCRTPRRSGCRRARSSRTPATRCCRGSRTPRRTCRTAASARGRATRVGVAEVLGLGDGLPEASDRARALLRSASGRRSASARRAARDRPARPGSGSWRAWRAQRGGSPVDRSGWAKTPVETRARWRPRRCRTGSRRCAGGGAGGCAGSVRACFGAWRRASQTRCEPSVDGMVVSALNMHLGGGGRCRARREEPPPSPMNGAVAS